MSSTEAEVAIALLPGFPLYDLAALCDTFLIANRQVSRPVFKYELISMDGLPVVSSIGAPIQVQTHLDVRTVPPNIILLSGNDPDCPDHLADWLNRAVAEKSRVMASGFAVTVMARAGLLTGKACAVHWAVREAFEAQWPGLALSERLYLAQDKCLTCAGGKALIDFSLAWIAMVLGDRTARQVADSLNYDRLRASTEYQRQASPSTIRISNSYVQRALQVIDENIAKPLSAHDFAAAVGIGSRQLQRLFKQHFNISPCKFSLLYRLKKARRLIVQTDVNIAEISAATGFSSLENFRRSYLAAFGYLPQLDRKRFC